MKSDGSRLRHTRAFSAGGIVVRRATFPPTQQPGAEPLVLNSPASGVEAPLGTDLGAGTSVDMHSTLGTAVEVVLVGYPREDTWVLPKGTPAAGETPPQTAVREVREETGLEVRIIRQVGSIHYAFTRRGVRFNKEVLHYLMVAVGGDVSLHDHEYDEARWFPLAEALRRLRHKNEADVLLRAEPLIIDWLERTGDTVQKAPLPEPPPPPTSDRE